MAHFLPDLSIEAPRQRPLEAAPETYLIRALTPSVGGTWTNLNSMLIAGAEPVVVDTGMVTNRNTWFEDVFSIVSPQDVRWIFVTHNDSDHSGNMVEALERCPNAMLVTSHGESFRSAQSFGVPYERMRFVNAGEGLQLPDRVLHAVRPPVYDSPYTRGVFDERTRVFYASDAFCAPMGQEPVDWIDELPEDAWAKGFSQFHHVSLCPWITMVDRAVYRNEVMNLASLGMETILGAHTPAIGRQSVAAALENMARLPDAAFSP